MTWTYELDRLCCADKRARITLKDGSKVDCTPSALAYDIEGNEEMVVKLEDGRLYSYPENEIAFVEEIE